MATTFAPSCQFFYTTPAIFTTKWIFNNSLDIVQIVFIICSNGFKTYAIFAQKSTKAKFQIFTFSLTQNTRTSYISAFYVCVTERFKRKHYPTLSDYLSNIITIIFTYHLNKLLRLCLIAIVHTSYTASTCNTGKPNSIRSILLFFRFLYPSNITIKMTRLSCQLI